MSLNAPTCQAQPFLHLRVICFSSEAYLHVRCLMCVNVYSPCAASRKPVLRLPSQCLDQARIAHFVFVSQKPRTFQHCRNDCRVLICMVHRAIHSRMHALGRNRQHISANCSCFFSRMREFLHVQFCDGDQQSIADAPNWQDLGTRRIALNTRACQECADVTH